MGYNNGSKPVKTYIKREDLKFVNPYNFIQVNTNKSANKIDASLVEGELYTGVLNCKLITKTPLAMPYVDNAIKDKHNTYNFFSYEDGIPVIPGSSLRGPIRSMYETLTDSCFVTSREDDIITARSNKAYMPGILKRDGNSKVWKLYEAERYIFIVKDGNPDPKKRKYKDFDRSKSVLSIDMKLLHKDKYVHGNEVKIIPVSEGETEYKKGGKFQIGKYIGKILDASEKNPKAIPGYMCIGEEFNRKHFENVFVIKEGKKPITIDEDSPEFKGLLESYKIYNDSKINKKLGNTTYYRGFEKAKSNGVIPLWYQRVGEGNSVTTYLSLASIGRYAFEKNMGGLLNKKVSCNNREAVCPACALFGMTGKEKSLGSRIRVTEARLDDEFKGKKITSMMTLKELASPRISYAPFYVRGSKNEVLLYDNANACINGRKMYWHNNTKYYDSKGEETKRNATMELVESGVSFNFKVYYDKITKEQLDALIWSLTLGENQENSTRCYKLGHGKPIGLGSSKIIVESKMERANNDTYKLNVVDNLSFSKEQLPEFFDATKVDDILCIADMNSVNGEEVRYPYIYHNPNEVKAGMNDIASHKWFTKNYSVGATQSDQKYPSIQDIKAGKRLCAYEFKVTSQDNSYQGNGNKRSNNGQRFNGNKKW